MTFKTLEDFDFNGKTVLLRADLNVPAQLAKVTDTTRIDRLKPTIDHLRKNGAKVLVLSHFGRPEGEQTPSMSLAFLLPYLEDSWCTSIAFARDCIGENAQKIKDSLQNGQVALLENVRFHKGEKAHDPEFVKALAELGDIYINDAFSASHRAHASTEGLAHVLPSGAGLLMEKELNALGQALENPEKPVAAIVGGSKISTKLEVLNNLVEKVDMIILGGGMANTFLYANGANVGSSLCEKDMKDQALKIMQKAEEKNCQIILPTDCVAIEQLKTNAASQIADAQNVPSGLMAVDIGPNSAQTTIEKLNTCKTVLWNGPLGVFEIKPFDEGTNALARHVSQLTKQGKIISIAGGGDTVAALQNADSTKGFTYVSTAGGAFLEYIEGKDLPGVAALKNNA